jgi:type II secretion system protein N
MRLPRLRVPRPRLSFEWLGVLGGRTTLLYVGYTALLFVVFLLVTFPHDLLIKRALGALSRGPLTLQFTSGEFAWHKGYELSGLRLVSASDADAAYLECKHLWVRPSLTALVHGDLYDLLLSAELYSGTAQGEVKMFNGGLGATLQLQGVDLGSYRALTALLEEGQIAGKISGQLDFEGHGAEGAQLTGDVAIDGAGLNAAKFSGMAFALPDIHLRQIKTKFVAHGGRLEIQEFQSVGDVNVDGSGHILLKQPVQDSVLNLRLTIEQSVATPDAMKTLIALIPRPPGSKPDAPITITGTLGKPKTR